MTARFIRVKTLLGQAGIPAPCLGCCQIAESINSAIVLVAILCLQVGPVEVLKHHIPREFAALGVK